MYCRIHHKVHEYLDSLWGISFFGWMRFGAEDLTNMLFRCIIKCFLREIENSLERYLCQRPSLFECVSRDGDFVYLILLTGQCVDHYLPFKLKWSRSLQYGSLWWRWWLMVRIWKNTFKSLSEMCSIFVNLFRTENCILTLCGSKCHFNYLA